MKIGAVDISFSQKDKDKICGALVVCAYPSMELVYEDYEITAVTIPYIPGFLAFRELPTVLILLERLKEKDPSKFPQVFFRFHFIFMKIRLCWLMGMEFSM
jgi:endonuclease V